MISAMMTADTMTSSTMIIICWLRAFSMTNLLSRVSCCACVSVVRCFQRASAVGDFVDPDIGRHLGDDGIDLVVGLHAAAARGLAPLGRRRKLELQRLRVVQGDVADRIAGGGHLIAHQADDRELVAVRAERHLLADRQAGGTVDDHLVMIAQDVAAGDELARPAGPAGLIADEKHAQRLAVRAGSAPTGR